MDSKKLERAILFIDGSNFYHGIKSLEVSVEELDYERLSEKLVLGRDWLETRYYVGQVRKEGDLFRHKHQEKFLRALSQFDRVSCHLGRLESRPAERTAKKLARWLVASLERSSDGVTVSDKSRLELEEIAKFRSVQYVEKAVDVMIAVDMVSMAYEDKYDVAYLLSADGDFTPAIETVRKTGRKVFVVSASPGYKVSQAANAFIPLKREILRDCLV